MNSPAQDSHGRYVKYLRVSVTDRCNLRCSYCATDDKFTFIPHERIISYEEILQIVDACVSLGIDKVRLTGGEPFARKGFVLFLETLRKVYPDLNIRITTNATLLDKWIPHLKALQVNALNISFDTFNPEVFKQITGQNLYNAAYTGLLAAIDSGIRVKVNSVALKGVNDKELPDFVHFAMQHDVDVRFIEQMPLGGRGGWSESTLWQSEDILRDVAAIVPIIRVSRKEDGVQDHGPASMYALEGGKGRIGIISPLSNHFCHTCNRLRITSDGKLRTCLFSDVEYPMRELLRQPETDRETIMAFLREKLETKPIGSELLALHRAERRIIHRGMSTIGG